MNKRNTDTTVLVGMSGGVDSSVAAALLVEQGYNVIGVTMKLYRRGDVTRNRLNGPDCRSPGSSNDARLICEKLGIPHHTVDFTGPFREIVIADFISEYLNGRTPNPCVICNRKIKWGEMLGKADLLGARYIATGHYARVRKDDTTGRYVVSRGADIKKEQSYALWALTQESLSRTVFPLGDLTKREVRSLAEKMGLQTASKPESYEICFIPDNDYGRFLKNNVDGLEERVGGGDIVMDGRIVGKHRGFPFYTIGQRKGLGLSNPDPVYVTKIDHKKNIVVVGKNSETMNTGLIARDCNLMKYATLGEGMDLLAKIRYKDVGGYASVRSLESGRVHVAFHEPKRAITPGQSIVFYEGEDIVAGAIIDEVLD